MQAKHPESLVPEPSDIWVPAANILVREEPDEDEDEDDNGMDDDDENGDDDTGYSE